MARERLYDRKRKPLDISKMQKKLFDLKIENGGKCTECGFDKEVRILQFHHLRDKKFNLSQYRRPLEQMREEAKKCILLCPNCHAKEHLYV